jgi:hypothetical protein
MADFSVAIKQKKHYRCSSVFENITAAVFVIKCYILNVQDSLTCTLLTNNVTSCKGSCSV